MEKSILKGIKEIYNHLLTFYGRQGWWPLSGLNRSIEDNDRDWDNYVKLTGGHASKEDFIKNWPRHLGVLPSDSSHQFEIITGSILTQNTSWSNVERVIYNLNRVRKNTIEEIKNIDLSELASLIRSAGYHNQKAERLKIIAHYLTENPLEKLFNIPLYELRKELLSIKGIGPETADSITLYGGNIPVFIIDNYTKRIFSRIFPKDCGELKRYDDWQRLFMESFAGELNRTDIFKEFHGLIVRHGKEFCRAKPLCKDCFLFEKI